MSAIDPSFLLKLRLVVARYGEMDIARWWNTKEQLGRLGAMALGRGFPRTHYFAQARSVFAVAAQRCAEVFDPPGSVTLWRMPDSIEQAFEAKWEEWLEQTTGWAPFFQSIESLPDASLANALQRLDLVTETDIATLASLKRASAGRSVPLPAMFSSSMSEASLLALGFSRSEPGALAVPYARYDHV